MRSFRAVSQLCALLLCIIRVKCDHGVDKCEGYRHKVFDNIVEDDIKFDKVMVGHVLDSSKCFIVVEGKYGSRQESWKLCKDSGGRMAVFASIEGNKAVNRAKWAMQALSTTELFNQEKVGYRLNPASWNVFHCALDRDIQAQPSRDDGWYWRFYDDNYQVIKPMHKATSKSWGWTGNIIEDEFNFWRDPGTGVSTGTDGWEKVEYGPTRYAWRNWFPVIWFGVLDNDIEKMGRKDIRDPNVVATYRKYIIVHPYSRAERAGVICEFDKPTKTNPPTSSVRPTTTTTANLTDPPPPPVPTTTQRPLSPKQQCDYRLDILRKIVIGLGVALVPELFLVILFNKRNIHVLKKHKKVIDEFEQLSISESPSETASESESSRSPVSEKDDA